MKKKIKTIIFSVILLNYSVVTAQDIALDWAKATGGTDYDEGRSVTTDASGNIYTIGYFQGTADFDPSAGTYELTSAGSADIFIQKLDASGNFLWAKRMGGTDYDEGRSVTTDASGNIYTIGYFQGTADFDPSANTYELTSAGIFDIFIQKLDASGNFLWAKAMGGTSGDVGYSVCIDASGNIYTTGSFQGTVDFDPSTGTYELISAGGYDIFIQKLDADGNFIWAKAQGGTSDDYDNSVTIDVSGNIYTTGFFRGTADFDPSSTGTYELTSAGLDDIFIQKLDADGNLLWAKAPGGANNDYGNSISTDASGNSYTTGYFLGTVDFDPSAGTYELTSAGGADIFIQKLDASGNFLWAKAQGGTNNDYGSSISTDASGNSYTTGSFEGTADFDPSAGTYELTSAGQYDIFIQKLDASGNLLWAKRMGGTSVDVGYSVSTDAYGNSYTTGSFQETADFDPSAGTYELTSAGSGDIFVAKYAPTATDISDLPTTGISIYPNPTSGKLSVNSEKLKVNSIAVTDITGKTVQSFSNSQINQFSNYEIDLSDFNTGIYLIKLQTDKEVFTTKIVKE